ncbi:MAG: hypothetical protein QXK94_09090 [Candidatus Jordarchaeales archaeon]
MNGYAVFKCPNCNCYTFAPTSQKSRRCPRCGRVVKVDLLHAQVVGDLRRANELVKLYNARSAPPEVKEVIREQAVKAEDRPPKAGVRSSTLLMKVLVEHCSEREVSLNELEELCERYGLDVEWVKEKLPQLTLKGVVLFPSPWTVRCTVSSHVAVERAPSSRGATGLVKAVIDAFSVPTPKTDVVKMLVERGYSPEKVEEVIEKLHRSGVIIEEKPGVFRSAR